MTSIAEKKDVFELGASEMAAKIASGELSVIGLAEELLDRVKKHDTVLEAFSYMDVEGIMNEAKELDDEAKAGKFRGPLHGVPFGIKEQFLLEGAPTRGDYKDPDSPTPDYSATVVDRLRDSGGLLFGKTYMVGPSGTPPTRNPWNIEHTPGGSSSGSGAAVGARFVPFALSEQTGGSGIRPAAYCGVSGLKPTFGRNSRRGMFPLSYSTDYPCIIATTIEDVARVFEVTSGYDPMDPTSLDLPPGKVNTDVSTITPPKIGVVRNFFPEFTTPEVNEAIDMAAKKLAAAGATVVDMTLPKEFGIVWPNSSMHGAEGQVLRARAKADKIRSGVTPALLGPASTETVSPYGGASGGPIAEFIPATYYLHAQRIRRWLRAMVDEAISEYDAILMATAPAPAPKNLSISGDPTLLVPWSQLGNPAISIPGGLAENGMPIGLQLVAPNLQDEALLSTGAWCENVIGRLPIPAMA